MHKMQKRIMVVLLMFAVAFVVGQSKVSFAKAKPKLQGHVNINTATEAQLAMLPGIGDKLAKKIIEHRTKNGLFKALEDIKKVKGVKDKKFEKFKDLIILEGETTIEVVKDE